MGRPRRLGPRVAAPLRILALVATILVAGLYFIVGATSLGLASEPTDTAAPTATTSTDTSPAPTPAPDASPTPSYPVTDSPSVPTPVDSPTPTPTPSRTRPQPGPAASGTSRHNGTPRTHERRSGLRPNADLNTGSPYLVLTAGSLDAVGLTYEGTVTVPGPSGDVQVLRFTMTSGALNRVSYTQPCGGGAATGTEAESASLTGVTFDAVRLDVTVGGTPVTFTVGNPPSTAFPDEILLVDVTLTATSISATALTMPSFTTTAATC